VPEAGLRSVQDEASDAVGMLDGKDHRERTALAPAHHVSPIEAGRVENGERIRHPLHQGRDLRGSIGEAGPTLVETHETRERGHPLTPTDPSRFLPVELEMGDPAGDHQQVH
jgi:hypothetical protein